MPSYFEITITGRQMAAAVAGVAVLVLAAFGIGIVVGGRGGSAPAETDAGMVAVAPEPALHAVGAVQTASPAVVPGEPTPGATPASPAEEADGRALSTAAPAQASAAPILVPTAVPTPSPTAVPTRPPAPSHTAVGARGSGEWVQVGALVQQAAAERVRRRVLELGYTPVQVVVQLGEDGKYRVRVGPLPDIESAQRVAARLRTNGFAGAFVVKP